ncbi:DUF2235 domain-containing protein [Chryseobacterium sp. 1B4]
MLARTFCNQFLTDYAPGNCIIKFLGAFDTVESRPFNTYNMHIPGRVENALHICAVNESRFSFRLPVFLKTQERCRIRNYKPDHLFGKKSLCRETMLI